ncbi:hypothetical protein GRI34_08930 [Erythrobacter aquimaris]|uniref:Secreted protein n=1 Tax=Qipengyuania aquimaris TaxID=255984 RepID=A0A6I4TKN7_9SPHN|nr:hypothetical protein [Qipengyuania aquimaris]MXO96535.1 hypothetical protein [Qipengyuania aquimaris]
MTLSLDRSAKISVFVSAFAYTALTFGALTAPTAAEARSTVPYYTAELAQPAAERTTVAGGVAWICSDTSCVARKGTSRPMRICRELKRDLGEVKSFTAKGKALDADKLAKCNG